MEYLLLIYGEESAWDSIPASERDKVMQEYTDFTNSIARSGHLRGGNELDSIRKARTIRVRNGRKQVVDGPFAETKEQLGGYYLVEARDIDEALEMAARIPAARHGSIEVRPIIPHDMPA